MNTNTRTQSNSKATLTWLVIVIVTCCCRFAHSQTVEPFLNQPRETRFAQLVAALEKVRITQQSSQGADTREGFRNRKHSEIHIAFLDAVSGRADTQQNGVILFPVQVVGLFNAFNSRGTVTPVRQSASDFQTVTVAFHQLFTESTKLKAKIDVPRLNQGSDFDAIQLTRDKIIELIEWFLPECEIDGVRKFYEKTIVVKNNTDERILVRVQYLTRERTETGYQWTWKPALPGYGRSVQQLVEANRTESLLDANEQPLHGSCIRIWAESDSGETWNESRSTDLWLVSENSALKGERAYHAKAMESHTFEISPKAGPRVFTERLVTLRNETPERLTGTLRFLSSTNGTPTWQSTGEFVLEPGQTLVPRRSDGLRIRASQMQVRAISDRLHFGSDSSRPRWLIDEVNGKRVYRAAKIGEFIYSFTSNVK